MFFRPRLISALIGAAIGIIWGGFAASITGHSNNPLPAVAIAGIAGTITGVITGMHGKVFAITILGIVVAIALWAMITP